MARAPDGRKEKAKELYESGVMLIEIANQLNVPEGTVRSWKNRGKWDCNATQENKCNVANKKKEYSWVEIEHEYVTDISATPIKLEQLSQKYNIPLQTMYDQSARNKWSEKRKKYKESTKEKLLDKSSSKDADRILKLLEIADIASQKAEQSLGELETYLVKNKTKTKTVEYKDAVAIGKPTKEVIEENETLESVIGPVDRQGLLFLTSAIKNIKDIYSITSDLEKKNAEIALLQAKANSDNSSDSENKVADILRGLVDGINSKAE